MTEQRRNTALQEHLGYRGGLPVDDGNDFPCFWIDENVVEVEIWMRKCLRVYAIGGLRNQVRSECSVTFQQRPKFVG